MIDIWLGGPPFRWFTWAGLITVPLGLLLVSGVTHYTGRQANRDPICPKSVLVPADGSPKGCAPNSDDVQVLYGAAGYVRASEIVLAMLPVGLINLGPLFWIRSANMRTRAA